MGDFILMRRSASAWGKVSAEAKKLMAVTEESLYAGIKEAKPRHTLGDIGYAIERVVHKNKFLRRGRADRARHRPGASRRADCVQFWRQGTRA